MTAVAGGFDRQTLLGFLQRGEAYGFLNRAEAFVRQAPHDSYLRLMAAREYLKLGLIEPARQMIEGVTGEESGSELERARKTLANLPSGRIAWTDRKERFEANLAALARRCVDVEMVRTAWRDRQERFALYQDSHGCDQVRAQEADGGWRWVPFLGNHRLVADAQPLPEGVRNLMPGPYLFESLDLGWYFQRVYETTKDSFLGFACALFVVEQDPAVLALVLHLHDWVELIADERVFWLIGADSAHRLSQVWDHDFDLPFPAQAFTYRTFHPPAQPGCVEVIKTQAARREREIRESLADLELRYARRDLPYWARRFDEALTGRGPGLKILAAVSTHTTFLQHSMRDAVRALTDLGHECDLLIERTRYGIIGPLRYHEAVRRFDPDVFLSLDHLRHEFRGYVPTNLPILTWDQDQLPQVFTPENMRRVPPQDFLVGCSKSAFIRAGCDPRQYLHARLPTCPEQFSGLPLSDEEIRRFACDVSYISHASQTPAEFHVQERETYRDPSIRRILDVLYERVPAALVRWRVMEGPLSWLLLEEACRQCGVRISDEALVERLRGWYLWRLADRIFRHEALEWCAAWARRTGRSFRIYGNGWDKHPTLAAFAAGPVDNGRNLLCVYRASRINLQLMPAGFLHQRALDGLAAGGFFLSRLVPNDFRGKALRRLIAELDARGITRTEELLNTTDPALRRLLEEYQDTAALRADPRKDTYIDELRLRAELLYPDEVFPDFREVTFDSAEEFSRAAERFLSHDAQRAAVAQGMRAVVVEKFSYRAAMAQFLGAMRDHLQRAAEAHLLTPKGTAN